MLLTLDPRNWVGDKGYVGIDMITPFKKSTTRCIIEQVISHFKNWRIMNTDYRRPIDTFDTTISAVVGLHFYRMA